MTATEAQLVIRRLALQGEIPGDAGSAGMDLARIAKERLDVALSEVLAPLNTSEGQVVFIRKLKVDLDLDDQLSPREIAVAWANCIKNEFVATIARKNADIVVFPNPATYLARFLVDCAQGQASGVWYYRQFDGLWPLTASAAIRTAILADMPLITKAMRCLVGEQVIQICDVLTDCDAERILAGFGIGAEITIPERTEMQRYLARISSKGMLVRAMSGGLKQKVLALVLVARADGVSTAADDACAHYHGIVEQLLSDFGLDRRHVYKAIVSENRPLLSGQDNAAVQADLVSLFALGQAARKLLADHVVSEPGHIAEPGKGVRFSQFGNVILLWPQIAASSWYRQFDSWKPPADCPARNILALVTLCACQGHGKFGAAWNDGLLRDVSGIDPSLSLGGTLEWLNDKVKAAVIDDLGRIFRTEFDSTEPEEVHRSVSCEFGDVQITVASPKRVWTGLRTQADPPRPAGYSSKNADRRSEQADADAADLELLWLADPRADTQTRIFIALLAQHTLRTFAYRLAGFSGSSLRYLINNLLSMSVNYVSDDSSEAAYLSRVPLSVVLNMAGINRGEVTLPNLSGRPIRLGESG